MAGVDIYTERIDDVPLLVEQQRRMGIAEVIDSAIRPHGNRAGLSSGELTTFWLAYILSESDHRMSEVESWASGLQETLSALATGPVREKDFTDDRLADLLRLFSHDETWGAIEEQLGRRLVRVYELELGTVRLDSTSAAVYHDPAQSTLFLRGQSKDHRPDLAQFKVMLASLDPMGMPLATLPVAGNIPDDGLYLPAIQAARRVVGRGGRLYIGDTKMGSVATRASLQAAGDYYLLPLAQSREVPELLRQLLARVWSREQALERVWAATEEEEGGGDRRELLALGYEASRPQQGLLGGGVVSWQERVLAVYSLSLARQLRRNLADRLSRCMRELEALTPPRARGRRQWYDLEGLQAAARSVLKKHQVESLLEVSYAPQAVRRHINRRGDRPGYREEAVRHVVRVRRDGKAITAARRLLGWRLYATNAPVWKLGLAAAVLAYRASPRMERNFHRLKGRPLGLRPVYVQREDHTRGLVRLLSLALRVLTLVEQVVRGALATVRETLSGLHAANPKRQTARPTTERLLGAFQGVTLTVIHLPGELIRHVTPLSELQRTILDLLGLPPSIYEAPANVDASAPP
jgi:transposase